MNIGEIPWIFWCFAGIALVVWAENSGGKSGKG